MDKPPHREKVTFIEGVLLCYVVATYILHHLKTRDQYLKQKDKSKAERCFKVVSSISDIIKRGLQFLNNRSIVSFRGRGHKLVIICGCHKYMTPNFKFHFFKDFYKV